MELSDKLFHVAHSLLTQLPSLLMILACLIFSFLRWKLHPKVSMMVVIALLLLFFQTLAFTFAYAFVPDLILGPTEYRNREFIYLAIGFLYSLTLAVVFVILLAAIFMQRGVKDSSANPATSS